MFPFLFLLPQLVKAALYSQEMKDRSLFLTESFISPLLAHITGSEMEHVLEIAIKTEANTLFLINKNISSDAMFVLERSLSKLPFTKMVLKDSVLSQDAYNLFVQQLSTGKLRQVVLDSNTNKRTSLDNEIDIRWSNLDKLELSGTFEPWVLRSVVDQLPATIIKELDLSNTATIKSKSLVSNCQVIERLANYYSRTTIKSINLRKSFLFSDLYCINQIQRFLLHPEVHHLLLSKNRIDTPMLQRLAISAKTTIYTLDLSLNNLTNSHSELFKITSMNPIQLLNLTDCQLSWSPMLKRILFNLPSSSHLALDKNPIGNRGFRDISDFLRHSKLSLLTLDYTDADANGFLQLAYVLPFSKLTVLSASGNSIDSNSMSLLASGICHSNIQFLTLDSMKFTENPFNALFSRLSKSKITHLSLVNNSIPTESLLKGVVGSKLRYLDLTDSWNEFTSLFQVIKKTDIQVLKLSASPSQRFDHLKNTRLVALIISKSLDQDSLISLFKTASQMKHLELVEIRDCAINQSMARLIVSALKKRPFKLVIGKLIDQEAIRVLYEFEKSISLILVK